MALTVITKAWASIARNLLEYVYEFRCQHDNIEKSDEITLAIYNEWSDSCGHRIADTELALWCVDYISTLLDMSVARLYKAMCIDRQN